MRAPAVSACASGQCVRQRLTRIMPVYQLDFDWFEKSVWFGGEIEYCAMCPYMAHGPWVSGSSPDLPKIKVPQIKLDRKAKLFVILGLYSTIFFVWPTNKKQPRYGHGKEKVLPQFWQDRQIFYSHFGYLKTDY